MVAAGILCSLLLSGDSVEQPPVHAVPVPEWNEVFAGLEGWNGGDAIYSVPLSDKRLLWLFADTWVGRIADGRHAPGSRIINNTLAIHERADGPPKRDAVSFHWGPESKPGQHSAWIWPEGSITGEEEWFWPADGIEIMSGGERTLAIFLWRVARNPGGGAFGFRLVGNSLAVVPNPGDKVEQWRPKQVLIPHGRHASKPGERKGGEINWGCELVPLAGSNPPQLLVFGVRESPPTKQLVAARVPTEKIDQFDQWEFRTKDGWRKSPDDAASLADGVPNELSISPVMVDGRTHWILTQSQMFLGDLIELRVAADPLGPWGKTQPIYRVPDVAADKQYFTYAAKAHPELARPDELLITYVVNSLDFKKLVEDASIYRPKFIRLPKEALSTFLGTR